MTKTIASFVSIVGLLVLFSISNSTAAQDVTSNTFSGPGAWHWKNTVPDQPTHHKIYNMSVPGGFERMFVGYGNNVGLITTAAGGTGILRPLVIGNVTSVAGLPSCTEAALGARATVTDALTGEFNDPVVAGGTLRRPVWCNGTAWFIG